MPDHRSVRTPLAVPLALCLLLAACSPALGSPDGGTSTAPPQTPAVAAPSAAPAGPTTTRPTIAPSEGFAVTTVALAGDGARLDVPVWVADEPDLRARGLMQRDRLPDGAGMVFVFPEAAERSFWMKNTTVPLSIAFVGADGRVVDIADMEPCTAEPCPRYRSAAPAQYALEVAQGWFDRRGVEVGWTMETGELEAQR